MSPDLEAAGREVVHAPVAEPTSLDGLTSRVRMRRARRATAVGALTLAFVVGIAAVAVAANGGDDKASVAVTPPGDLVCTRASHDFGAENEARSIWKVTDPASGASVVAARVFTKTNGNHVETVGGHPLGVADETLEQMQAIARACVDKPPVVAANDWPRTGVLVHAPADSPTTLVVDTNGVVLGRAELDDLRLAEAFTSLYVRVDANGHVEVLRPSIPAIGTTDPGGPTIGGPDGTRALHDASGPCDKPRTLVQELDREFPLLSEDEGSNGDSHVTRARGWFDFDTAVVEIASKTCRGGDMSFAGVFAVNVETHAPRVLMPEIDGSIESLVFVRTDVMPPPEETTSTTASHSTPQTTPQTTPTTTELEVPQVTVPNVVGLDAEAARSAIIAARLNSSIRLVAARTVAPGTAFMQSPSAGQQVDPTTLVIVRVAFAPADMTLAEARAKWAARSIAHYSFEYWQRCFCTPETTAKVRVTVVNGRVKDVVAIDPQQQGLTDWSQYRTVEKLFDLIAENEASAAMNVVATYEPSSGVPVSIDLSCVDENVSDCGTTYEIGDIEFSG